MSQASTALAPPARWSPRSVMIAHREPIVAEAMGAALERYPGIGTITVATTTAEAQERWQGVHAAALDENLIGVDLAARALRRKGIRVVILGAEEGEDLRVSTGASIARLASALVPGIVTAHPGTLSLTPREQEVLGLVARGLTGKQIARHLGIRPKTVEQHKSRIYSKLGVPNQAAAVGFALVSGAGGRQF